MIINIDGILDVPFILLYTVVEDYRSLDRFHLLHERRGLKRIRTSSTC